MTMEHGRPRQNQTLSTESLGVSGSRPEPRQRFSAPRLGGASIRLRVYPDQAGNLSQRGLRGTRIIAEMIRELEEIPLPLCQRSQRLPSLEGRVLHRANPIRGLHVIEESTQGGKDLLGCQQDQAGLAGTDCGDLEGHRPGPLLAEEASKSLGQTPFDPCDILSASSVRREDLKARNPISTRDRTRFPPNRRL